MKVELEKVAALTIHRLKLPLLEHEKNPRIHPEPGSEEWELLKASLQDAYFDPLVWNARNSKLVSGHLRQKVMLTQGFTHCDCVVVDWSENEHLARMIAANRGMGQDDDDGLKLILEGLEESGFNLALSGLSDMELERVGQIARNAGDDDSDSVYKDLPEFHQEMLSKMPTVVHFMTLEDKLAFGALLGQQITEKTKSMWYPKTDLDQTNRNKFIADGD